jgi:hypothetical protein
VARGSEAGLISPITRVARLDGGVRLPLPAWSLRLGRSPNRLRFVFLGDPDFRRTRPPWRYVERLGAYHRLEAGDVQVTVIAHRRGEWLTEASFVVD